MTQQHYRAAQHRSTTVWHNTAALPCDTPAMQVACLIDVTPTVVANVLISLMSNWRYYLLAVWFFTLFSIFTHFHVVPSLRVNGVLPPLSYGVHRNKFLTLSGRYVGFWEHAVCVCVCVSFIWISKSVTLSVKVTFAVRVPRFSAACSQWQQHVGHANVRWQWHWYHMTLGCDNSL